MEAQMQKYTRVQACSTPRIPKVQEVVALSWDFGMDWCVSWIMPKEDPNLDTIWGHFEEFCKPQVNEVRSHFDLLTASGKVQEV